MKNPPIFTHVSLTRCLKLLPVAALALALVPGPGMAGEGYQAFATRLVAAPPEGAAVAEDVEAGILRSLNSYRTSKGRKPLPKASAQLVLAARAQAMDLLQMGSVGHVASTGHSFESRMRAILGKSMFLPAMAENAARDRKKGADSASKAQALMTQWIKSSRHRKSLTDLSYVAVAIGAARRGDEVYAVQIFVGPETKTNLFQ